MPRPLLLADLSSALLALILFSIVLVLVGEGLPQQGGPCGLGVLDEGGDGGLALFLPAAALIPGGFALLFGLSPGGSGRGDSFELVGERPTESILCDAYVSSIASIDRRSSAGTAYSSGFAGGGRRPHCGFWIFILLVIWPLLK